MICLENKPRFNEGFSTNRFRKNEAISKQPQEKSNTIDTQQGVDALIKKKGAY
jgi:hypothetical protein